MNNDPTEPFGLPLGRLLPVPTPTEPIPALDGPPTPCDGVSSPAGGVLVAVKAHETCGPCGSSFAVEWVGRTDTLTVIREWRTGHRCEPPAPDGAGHKSAQVERVGFLVD